MNKNLKRLFVTITIITSLASINDAHATAVVEQYLKNKELGKIIEYLEDQQEWIENPEDMTDSLILDMNLIENTIKVVKNDDSTIRIKEILDELKPFKEVAEKQIQETKELEAQEQKEKQDKEEWNRKEEKRVKAELDQKRLEEEAAKLEQAQAKENERIELEADAKKLQNLRNRILYSGQESLDDSQKSQFIELERKEKERQKMQAEKREEQKKKREAEQKANQINDNLRHDLAKELSDRRGGGIGFDNIEDDNDEDDYSADVEVHNFKVDVGGHDFKADVDNNHKLPSYETVTYNNVPFTQLSPEKQEKIIKEYKDEELKRFYEKTQAKVTWDKVSDFSKNKIKNEYESDKEQKIIEYYYNTKYNNNKVSFDKLSSDQKEPVKNAFDKFLDKEKLIESYKQEYDKNIRKIHREDPQFKYDVKFFELNDELQKEYIQKKEKEEKKVRKKQEAEEKAKKSALEHMQRTNEITQLMAKLGPSMPPPINLEISSRIKKIKELELKINSGTKEERKGLKEELKKLKEEVDTLKKEQGEERIRVLKEKLKEKEEAEAAEEVPAPAAAPAEEAPALAAVPAPAAAPAAAEEIPAPAAAPAAAEEVLAPAAAPAAAEEIPAPAAAPAAAEEVLAPAAAPAAAEEIPAPAAAPAAAEEIPALAAAPAAAEEVLAPAAAPAPAEEVPAPAAAPAAAEEAAPAAEVERVRLANEAAEAEIAETTTMQTAVKKDEEIVNAMYNPTIVHDMNQLSSNIISNRITHTTLFTSAVAAGDEDEKVLDKGIWVAGIYGANKQGTQKEFIGYKGRTSGGTIGFDVGFESVNDLIGIAYTKLDSKFKSKDKNLNTKIHSHIIALYGQKELPKNFMMQAMFAYNHNIINSRINRLGTIASGKYKNNNYNFEGLLSYNYLLNSNISLIPNIGIKYGYSKDGQYQESNIGIQSLSVAAKKHNLWSGVLGGKVVLAPQKIYKDISITPALQASVENYFNNKRKKLHTKVKWKDKEIKETVALPKQPKIGYNIGASVLTEKGSVSVLLEYNCHLQKKYQSHQGFVKLKINL